MRFIRIQGMLMFAALLAVAPAFGQNAMPPMTSPAPAAGSAAAPMSGSTTAPTLTPPGSATSVPLLPDGAGTVPGSGLAGSGMLPSPSLPTTNLSAPSLYSGLGGPGTGGSDLTTILAGSSSMPLTLTLGQLDSHWRRITLGGNLDLGSISEVLSSFLGSAGVGVYYTKGETESIGDTMYLVAYRPWLSAHDLAAMTSTVSATAPPSPPKLTAQTPLALSLLNLQTAGSLTDIRPFNLAQEIADSASAAHAFSGMETSLGTAALGAMMAQPGTAFHAGKSGLAPQP